MRVHYACVWVSRRARHIRKDRDGEDSPAPALEARQNVLDAHTFQQRWLAPGGGHEGKSVQTHDGVAIAQHGGANQM